MEAVQAQVLTLVNTPREICTELRPPALDDLDLGLVVQRHVGDVQRETGLDISLHLSENRYETLGGLPEALSLNRFRTLQEALTNVWRHAQATRVHVSLMVNGRDVVLVVEDNGGGFDSPPAWPTSSTGDTTAWPGCRSAWCSSVGPCS